MRAFIDAALDGAALQGLIWTGLLFLGVALFQQLVSVAVAYLGQNVAWTATNALRAELAEHCLNLDMSFHNAHTPGELIERIDGDMTEMATFFSQFVVMLVGNALLLVGILAALYREDWRIGLAFTLFAVLTLAVLFRLRDVAVPVQKARRQAEAELFGFIEEQLAATEDVRSSGAVDFSIRELFRFQQNILKPYRRGNKIGMLLGLLMSGLLTIGNGLAIGLGYWFFINGAITIGTVYLLIYYVNLLEQPIWALTHQTQSFQTIGACVERLNDLRKVQSKVVDGAGVAFPTGALALDFANVSFAYHDSDNGGGKVLEGVNFCLDAGRVLGLLGRTGSGKTTLARLVFRLYDPAAGQVALGGFNLMDARLSNLRQRVAFVTQDVQLFRATVRDNLTFFDRSIADEQILAAIADLGLEDWYTALPKGLDTELEAQRLSAGEAQLLAFARVFLRDPGLVILDEASSRLDPATEQRVERAIDCLLQGRTAIIIAHRLGTVQRADAIMILDQGQVCEAGDRLTLAADPDSRFYHLLQTGLEEVLV